MLDVTFLIQDGKIKTATGVLSRWRRRSKEYVQRWREAGKTREDGERLIAEGAARHRAEQRVRANRFGQKMYCVVTKKKTRQYFQWIKTDETLRTRRVSPDRNEWKGCWTSVQQFDDGSVEEVFSF